MRILVLHSPYLSGAASGENRQVEDEVRLLEEAGHEVVRHIPERSARTWTKPLAEALGAVWSAPAVAEVQRLLRSHRPDIVHCHNLFPALSPAVIRAAAGRAAVVATLHNYRLLCLPATFQRHGELCERCLGHVPWRGVAHRCYRRSVGGSAALATSLTLHRGLQTFDRINLFLAVSDFVRRKHVEGGFSADRILVRPNFAWQAPRRSGPGSSFVFVGRLSAEKGLDTLLDAWRHVPARLLIVGDGPLGPELRRIAPPGVEFTGALPPGEIPGILANARALMLPARSYEGSPRSVIEGYAAGVPVAASAIGSIPEHVEDGVSGLLFPPDDAEGMAAAARRLLDDDESIRLGEGAWRLWADRFSPQRSLESLEAAYRKALE